MTDKKKSVLGRGLGALLNANDTTERTNERMAAMVNDTNTTATTTVNVPQGSVIINIPLEQIEVNPFQPRTTFEEESLNDLADSIKVHGVIQPITVRKIENNKYQLIAGERRLRASKLAGKAEVPAFVRLASDQESIEIALIENIQREDLNPLEIAINYKRLQDECDLTQEELAVRLGKNRSSVTNYMRLLRLPPDIQAGLRDEKITMGHAKALLAIENPLLLLTAFKDTVSKGLSVRQVEEMVRTLESKPKKLSGTSGDNKPAAIPFTIKKMQDQLITSLSTKVQINRANDGKGEIIIRFYNDDDLTRLVEAISEK
ncbi:MAG TPA: ParB/RepB/Spo0J family partition protein [Chitinophagales bacterium]|nr:ParB/RepB/Spo0J family partition protein [Chitinophagales bacterium]